LTTPWPVGKVSRPQWKGVRRNAYRVIRL
jgi:hypothetical protein